MPGDNNFDGTALAYPETDASFIGYVTPGITYQTHRPQTPSQPQDSRNATHQGYPPRRGRGDRGGYYGQGRPNMYTDTRLYGPHASSHQIIDQGRATSSYLPLNNGMANLNLQGARPHPQTASPAITTTTPSSSTAQESQSNPPTPANRVLLTRPQESTGLLPVELLELRIRKSTTSQWCE